MHIEGGGDNNGKNKKRIHVWIRLLSLFLLIGGLCWILYETGLITFFLDEQKMLDFIESLGPWGLLGFISLQVLQVTGIPDAHGRSMGLAGAVAHPIFDIT